MRISPLHVTSLLLHVVDCIPYFVPRKVISQLAPASFSPARKNQVAINIEVIPRVQRIEHAEEKIGVKDAAQKMLECGTELIYTLVSDDLGEEPMCEEFDIPERITIPDELVHQTVISPIIRDYFSQEHSSLLPELRNQTLFIRLIERAINLTYDYELEPGSLDSQNFPYVTERPTATTSRPPIARSSVSIARSHFSNLLSKISTELPVASSMPTLSAAASTITSSGPSSSETHDAVWSLLKSRVSSILEKSSSTKSTMPTSTLGINDFAEIWASAYPAVFASATMTDFAATRSSSVSLSSKYVSTRTLTPLYEGDPIPTVTMYQVVVTASDASGRTSMIGLGSTLASMYLLASLVVVLVLL